jgi:hypothetical protein
MDEAPSDEIYDVACPHCKKPFKATLTGSGQRLQGFKCPHCKLFVPLARIPAAG